MVCVRMERCPEKSAQELEKNSAIRNMPASPQKVELRQTDGALMSWNTGVWKPRSLVCFEQKHSPWFGEKSRITKSDIPYEKKRHDSRTQHGGRSGHTLPLSAKKNQWHLPIFFNFLCLFIYVIDSVSEERAESETQNPKQAPGSEPSAQSLKWGLNSRTVRSWPEPDRKSVV